MKKSDVDMIQYNGVCCESCFNLKNEFKTFGSCMGELILKCLNCGREYHTGRFVDTDIATVKFSEDEAVRGLEKLLEKELGVNKQ